MTKGSDTRFKSMDSPILTPLVRKALGNETVEVTSWHVQQVHGGYGHGSASRSAVHRVSGHGLDQGTSLEWSLILKVLRPPADRGQPSDFDYWRREAHPYESGLLSDLAGGLAAPRCFGVADRPGGECWIWMEDVGDDIGPQWPLEHYRVVARHLGQFNGAYLLGRSIPSQSWLSRGLLRSQLALSLTVSGITQLRNALEGPLVRCVFSPDVSDRVLRLWARRERFIEALERLAQTFCHMDAFRRNLFARQSADGGCETVAIDWDYVGIGAIGEEIAPLVGASLLWELHEVGWDNALELDRIVFEGYLDGLREAGWRGDPRLVRFGYAVASALRFGVAHTWWAVSVLLDEDERARWAQTLGCPMQEMVDHVAEWLCFLLTLGDEAWELLDEF